MRPDLARLPGEIADAVDAVTAASRHDYQTYMYVSSDETNRRMGVQLAGRWLIDPSVTIGPMLDGPATTVDRIDANLRAAGQRVRAGLSRGDELSDSEAKALGVHQMLAWALGDTGDSPVSWPTTLPGTSQRHAA